MTGTDMDSKLKKYTPEEREAIKRQYCGPIGEPGIKPKLHNSFYFLTTFLFLFWFVMGMILGLGLMMFL